MKIQCCSNDKILLEKLIRHFGEDCISVVTDIKLLSYSDPDSSDVTIIDLKYNSLSDRSLFSCPVVALTAIPSFTEAFTALRLGVRGYGNRQMRLTNLEQAVENVRDGQIWLPPDIVSSLIDVMGQGKDASNRKSKEEFLGLLSKREQEIANCIAKGLSNQDVADQLFISLSTVKAHLSSIYEKTGIRDRLELGIALSWKGDVLS